MVETKFKKGKRLLLRGVSMWDVNPFEGKVEEVSPSGDFVKINGTWMDARKLRILEDLSHE